MVIPRLWLMGGALALLVVTHGSVARLSWKAAVARVEAEHAAATRALNDELAREAERSREAAQAYLRERAARQTLQEALDDEAAQDPGLDGFGLGAGSMRRLNAIR